MGASKKLNGFLSPYLKEKGYNKKGSCYYKIENHIAFCISLDFPSCVRAWCHILPLYMPTEFIHLDYGNTIEPKYVSRQSFLSKYDDVTDEQASRWVNELTQELEASVFPFFNLVSSPEALAKYCVLPKERKSRYLPYEGGEKLYRLQGYTALYLGKTFRAKRYIKAYKKAALENQHISPKLVQERSAEADEMLRLALLPKKERNEYFSTLCDTNRKAMFG